MLPFTTIFSQSLLEGMPTSHLISYMGACPPLTSQDADDDRPQEGDRCNCAAGWGEVEGHQSVPTCRWIEGEQENKHQSVLRWPIFAKT